MLRKFLFYTIDVIVDIDSSHFKYSACDSLHLYCLNNLFCWVYRMVSEFFEASQVNMIKHGSKDTIIFAIFY